MTSVRGNPVEPRKTYWYHVYSHILRNNRYLFVLQNNNITAASLKSLKNDLKKSKLESLTVRNSIFRAAAKQIGLTKLGNLFQGQTMILFTDIDNNENPNLIKQVAHLSEKYKNNLLLVGGNVEGMIITLDTFKEIKELPSKVQLLGELLSVIGNPANSIALSLSQTPQLLSATLDQHIKQLQ